MSITPRKFSQLEKKELVEIFEEAKYYCSRWWLDKLDCRITIFRQKVEDISWEDALSKLTGNFVTLIERQNFVNDTKYMELGFVSTCAQDPEVEYFMWIILGREYGLTLAEKYNVECIMLNRYSSV